MLENVGAVRKSSGNGIFWQRPERNVKSLKLGDREGQLLVGASRQLQCSTWPWWTIMPKPKCLHVITCNHLRDEVYDTLSDARRKTRLEGDVVAVRRGPSDV